MVVEEYDSDTTNEVSHRNIVLSRIAYGRGEVAIDLIAKSFNLAVHDYNAEVQNTISQCVTEGASFQALRS